MAMGQHCSILQIVGFQNSGKTTLMEKLLIRANQKGLKAASIKHHGHGGVPKVDSSTKDSIRHFKAGAIVSSVSGDGVLQLSARVDDLNLNGIIDLYKFFSIDVIFVEGYKREYYPKVVLIRDEMDLPLLSSLSNIKCVISHIKLDKDINNNYQVFQLNEEELYIDFLIEELVKTSDRKFV
jgi:molybdopterin-guanine dinucleotide biosynthesis protein B